MWLYFIDKNIKEVRKNLKNVLYIRPYDIDSKRALFAVIKEEKGIYRRIQITEEMSKWNFPFETLNMFFEGPGHSFIKDFIILNGNATILNPAHFKGFNYYQLNIYALFNDGVATRIDHYEEDMKPYLTKESNFIDNYEIIENHCYGIMERCVIPKLKEKEETKTKKLTK